MGINKKKKGYEFQLMRELVLEEVEEDYNQLNLNLTISLRSKIKHLADAFANLDTNQFHYNDCSIVVTKTDSLIHILSIIYLFI